MKPSHCTHCRSRGTLRGACTAEAVPQTVCVLYSVLVSTCQHFEPTEKARRAAERAANPPKRGRPPTPGSPYSYYNPRKVRASKASKLAAFQQSLKGLEK